MRHFLLAACLLAATATTASAKRAPGAFAPRQLPALQVLTGDGPAAAYVQAHADALVACSANSRATFLRANISLRWDARGRVVRANVSSGSSAAFNRCARKALAGVVGGVTGRGTDRVAVAIRKPAIVAPAPAPKPPKPSSLQTCKADDDCAIHFQLHACFPGDPIGVNKTDMKAVFAAFPVKRLDCAMGGPQYERQRMENEHRWSVACEQSRCVVHEHATPSPIFP